MAKSHGQLKASRVGPKSSNSVPLGLLEHLVEVWFLLGLLGQRLLKVTEIQAADSPEKLRARHVVVIRVIKIACGLSRATR